jgi:hypothetical protein
MKIKNNEKKILIYNNSKLELNSIFLINLFHLLSGRADLGSYKTPKSGRCNKCIKQRTQNCLNSYWQELKKGINNEAL